MDPIRLPLCLPADKKNLSDDVMLTTRNLVWWMFDVTDALNELIEKGPFVPEHPEAIKAMQDSAKLTQHGYQLYHEAIALLRECREYFHKRDLGSALEDTGELEEKIIKFLDT